MDLFGLSLAVFRGGGFRYRFFLFLFMVEMEGQVQVKPMVMVMIFFLGSRFTVLGANEQEIDEDRHRIQGEREDENVLIAARFRYDQICDLIARQTCDCPSGQRDPVNGRNFAHTVYVGKEGGQVGKAAAVAEIDENEQNDTNHDDMIFDCTREKSKRGDDDFADENDFINGISVFEMIADCRVAQASRGVEKSRHSAEERRRAA